MHTSVCTSLPVFDIPQKLHKFGTGKINFLYIRYYLAA
jgi:hypothetical protein